MHLWVRLVLEFLQSASSLADMQQQISRLPQDLKGVYVPHDIILSKQYVHIATKQ
jgi:hypothetical protein